MRKQEGTLHRSGVKSQRLERTESIVWMLEDLDVGGFGQWKKRPTFKGKEKNPTGKGKGARKDGAKSSGQANAQKIQGQCWNCGKTSHQSKDCWARPQKQQSQGQANYPGKGNDEKGKSGKVEERKANPKMLEHLLGISKLEVQLRARWRRLHRRRRQAQWLVRLTRLNAQRWICVQPRWQQEQELQCGHWSWRNCVADERGLRM